MLQCTCPEEKREAIVEYLKTNTGDGTEYFKSKVIADALDLSSREVGANLQKLSEEGVSGIDIEQYAVSRSTTWKVDGTETIAHASLD